MTGSNFLQELFNGRHTNYDNFFNEILEPLFYEALRTEHDDDYYFHFNCKIPFLNGGLFDPIDDYDWKNIDINLSNDLFSNNNTTKEGDKGDGILDIFNRYNFTVKEDEPLEKEVAVDPEMLGKVFENLLEVTDRRSQGTFYTPREIVHYICQESLINYLVTELEDKVEKGAMAKLVRYGEAAIEHETEIIRKQKETKVYAHQIPETIRKHAKPIDEKLAAIHICDPAVGSGAFLVGMMSEIVRTRSALTPFIQNKEERTPYHFKRQAIEHSLYGVDIDSGAIEIAKLRLWLSLVVDEENRDKIQPLPNLDYKMIKGDSLLTIEKNIMTNNNFNQLIDIKEIYINESRISKKQNYRKQIEQLNDELTDGQKKFDLQIYFPEILQKQKGDKQSGFDVVIANPPYIPLQRDNGKLTKLYRPFKYETFQGRGDIYMLFYERGLQILKQKGTLCFITSNKWIQAKSGEKLRDYFSKNTHILTLLDMGADVFENATVGTNIILLKKDKENIAGNPKVITVNTKLSELQKYSSLSEYVEKQNSDILLSKQRCPWTIIKPAEAILKDRIEKVGVKLIEWQQRKIISIHRGLLTGFDPAFTIDNETKERLTEEDYRSTDILKPLVRGRNVGRYHFKWGNEWLIDTHNGYNNIERIRIEEYPAVKNHLEQYWQKIEKRQDQGDTPYNLRSCAYHEEFEKEKIVWTAVNSEYRSAILPHNYYLNNSLFMITGDYIRFICAYLNSKLCRKYLEWILSNEENYTYGSKELFEILPIPKVTEDNKIKFLQIEKLVDKILQSDPESPTIPKYQNQINQIIYELYDLTSEEIEITEGNIQ